MDRRYSEIHHHLKLAYSIARTAWNSHSANSLDTIMETQTTCEQTVIHSILENILFTESDHCKVAGHKVGPCFEILPGITDNSCLPACTRRCMDPHNIFSWNSKKSERIIIAKIRFSGCGEFADVRGGFDISRFYSKLLEFLSVKRDVIIN